MLIRQRAKTRSLADRCLITLWHSRYSLALLLIRCDDFGLLNVITPAFRYSGVDLFASLPLRALIGSPLAFRYARWLVPCQLIEFLLLLGCSRLFMSGWFLLHNFNMCVSVHAIWPRGEADFDIRFRGHCVKNGKQLFAKHCSTKKSMGTFSIKITRSLFSVRRRTRWPKKIFSRSLVSVRRRTRWRWFHGKILKIGEIEKNICRKYFGKIFFDNFFKQIFDLSDPENICGSVFEQFL